MTDVSSPIGALWLILLILCVGVGSYVVADHIIEVMTRILRRRFPNIRESDGERRAREQREQWDGWKHEYDMLRLEKLALEHQLKRWGQTYARQYQIPEGFRTAHAYYNANELVVLGEPEQVPNHNCDAMACGSTDHVIFRGGLPLGFRE